MKKQKLTTIQTVEQLQGIVSLLRSCGVQNISIKECEFDIRIKIIQQCNPKRLRFAPSKLPKFDGNFETYKKDCLVFFTNLYEKKQQKKKAKKVS